jgi:hypothetical protein
MAGFPADLDGAKPQRQELLKVVEADLKGARSKIDKYFDAFEAGRLSDEACEERVGTLAQSIRELEQRRDELVAQTDEARPARPAPAKLEEIRTLIRQAIETGPVTPRKGLLNQFVQEVRVKGPTSDGGFEFRQ